MISKVKKQNVKQKSNQVIELLTECLHPDILAKVAINEYGEILGITTYYEPAKRKTRKKTR